MSAKNKIRGSVAERVVRDMASEAERAWGSDGRAMGLTAKDDGIILGYRWQSKRFMYKNIPKWLWKNVLDYFVHGIEIVTIYIDAPHPGQKKAVYVVQPYEDWLVMAEQAAKCRGDEDE